MADCNSVSSSTVLMVTQFSSGVSFGRFPSIVRRKRTERVHVPRNCVASTPFGTSTNPVGDVNVVHNSKKRKIDALEELMAAEALIMMSQDHRKMKNVQLKSDVVGPKSVKDFIFPSMDERDARFYRTNYTPVAVNSKDLQSPLFSSTRKRTERKPKSNREVMDSTKVEEKDDKMERIDDQQVVNWKIDKPLFKSDINYNDRLMLHKDEVDKHILALMVPAMAELCRSIAGAEFEVFDVDDGSLHRLRLKKHTCGSGSFVFIGQWRKKFVIRKDLKVGDRIGLAWVNDKFLLKLLHKKERE